GFWAIHPQTISGGQGAEEKPQPLLRGAKAWLQVSFQALALKAKGWTTLIMRPMFSFRGLHLPEESAVAFSRALTESVSSAEAVGGAAERAVDARQRKLQHAPVPGCEARRIQVAQQARAFERQLPIPGEHGREWEEQPHIAGDGQAAGRLKGVAREQRAVAFVEKRKMAGRVPRSGKRPQR